MIFKSFLDCLFCFIVSLLAVGYKIWDLVDLEGWKLLLNYFHADESILCNNYFIEAFGQVERIILDNQILNLLLDTLSAYITWTCLLAIIILRRTHASLVMRHFCNTWHHWLIIGFWLRAFFGNTSKLLRKFSLNLVLLPRNLGQVQVQIELAPDWHLQVLKLASESLCDVLATLETEAVQNRISVD